MVRQVLRRSALWLPYCKASLASRNLHPLAHTLVGCLSQLAFPFMQYLVDAFFKLDLKRGAAPVQEAGATHSTTSCDTGAVPIASV